MPRINSYSEDVIPDPLSYFLIAKDGANFRVPMSSAGYIVSQYKMMPQVNDMLGGTAAQLAPFTTAAIGAGTSAPLVTEANHPGIWRIASAAAGNTGNSIGIFSGNYVLIGGGEIADFVLRWPTTAGLVSRAGFYDENTYTANPTDGAWINLAVTTLTGKTANNTSVSTTGTSYTIIANTWYRALVVVNEAATQVDFYLYDVNGAQLWHDSLTTNIPTAAGRECDFRTGAIKTTATGANILDVDWMAYYRFLSLTR